MNMNTILAVFFLFLPIAIAVYNIRTNEGSTKKRIIIATSVLGGLFLISLFLGVAEDMRLESYESDYITEANNGVLSSCFMRATRAAAALSKRHFPWAAMTTTPFPTALTSPHFPLCGAAAHCSSPRTRRAPSRSIKTLTSIKTASC